ncbi:MAG: amino acid ABC transporter permease [Clostridiales bacterium]|nr:amino acid ABC transporter permease [Clostridiales bacterium]
MEVFLEVTSNLANGFLVSFILFALTLILALPLGLLISFCTMSKIAPLRIFFKIIVWILRGTPLMLQLFVIFYGPGLLGLFRWPSVNTGWRWFDSTFDTRFIAALVAFAINYAAYFSEIYRGGIQSITKGQFEAGQVLGMTKKQIFFKIILLQVIKRILPPMSNEIITLIKDTSLANTLSVYEIIYEARSFMNIGLIWPFFYAGAFYLVFVGILTIIFNKLEKKLSYFRT